VWVDKNGYISAEGTRRVLPESEFRPFMQDPSFVDNIADAFDYLNAFKGLAGTSSRSSNCLLMRCVGPFVNAFLESRNRNPSSALAVSIDSFLTVQVV
jgi:hypothetical protein